MKILKQLTLACCLAGLCGCAFTSGTKVDSASISKIKKGVTTKVELAAMYGEPNSSTVDASGIETDRWTYFTTRASGASYIPLFGPFNQNIKTSSSTLEVKLNKDKIVDGFTLTQATDNLHP